MLNVRVRIDLEDSEKTLRLDGNAETYPQIDTEWSFCVTHVNAKRPIKIDLGRILDIQPYGDMLLVRTDLIVAEVWILDSGGDSAKVLRFDPFRPATPRQGAMRSSGALLKLRTENQYKRDILFKTLKEF